MIDKPVTVYILQNNRCRTSLNASAPKQDSSCVYSGGVKAIDTENCHIDIFVAVRIYFIGILLWPDVDSNQSSKLNRAYIADAVTEMPYLIIWQTCTRISLCL